MFKIRGQDGSGKIQRRLMAYIKDPKKDIAKLMYYAKERKVVKKVQNMIGVWL